MLSVIIPSRNVAEWPYIHKTIDDLFEKATGEIEIITVFDGYKPNPPVKERKNLTMIFNSEAKGMRQSINEGAALAKGDFVAKCDDHCMFGPGYDEILAADCDDNWLAVPSRYSLNGENWLAGETEFKKLTKYGPIEYLYLTYPFIKDDQFGWGFHGKKWHGEGGFTGGYFAREKKFSHILIDDILSFQGSCWFMPKELFFKIDGMQEHGYYQHQEAQELLHKVVLSGGRAIVNKKTWYAHLHKNDGRGYHMFRHHMIKSNIYSCDFWMNNRWPKQIHKFKHLIENSKWWPLELWPEDWDNPENWRDYDYNLWLQER